MDPQSQRPKQTVSKMNDELEAASRATAEEEYDNYERNAAAYKKSLNSPVRKMFTILILVVMLAVIGAAVYWFFLRNTNTSNTDNKQTNQGASQQNDDNDTTDVITTKTEHYVANNFSLEFDYPSDWKVTETAGEGVLTVTSPALQLKAATGETKAGQVVFMIRDKQQELKEFDGGNAVAVLASEKINYLKPSSVQRGATYLSFLKYAASSDGLDGVYITGDYGYQKDQAIPKADVDPVDPRINLVFSECAAGVCGENTPLTLSADMWQNEDFAKPITAIFQSLTVN